EDRFTLKNITGVDKLIIGHETLTSFARTKPARNLLANIPAVLDGRAIDPRYLHPSIYDQIQVGAAGFTSNGIFHGVPMLIATNDASNIFLAGAKVSPDTCYDFSVDVYVKMLTGHTVAELSGDLSAY